jgi:hypothetical protein
MIFRPKVSKSELINLGALFGALVLLPAIPGFGQANKFSSLYTNLKTECRAAFKQKRGEENGQDMPLRCKGFGGYEVRIDYSAASANLRVQPLGKQSDDSISLGMQPIDYDQTRKVEWRLANGKPFAIIYRIVKSKTDQPEEMWQPQNLAGEFLKIKGLKGYEGIDFEVDAATLTANVKAREMADNAYAQKH